MGSTPDDERATRIGLHVLGPDDRILSAEAGLAGDTGKVNAASSPFLERFAENERPGRAIEDELGIQGPGT